LTTDDELGGGDRTVLAGAGDIPDLGVRERGGVKLHGRIELIVEHQERCHLGHQRFSFVTGNGNQRLRTHPEASLGNVFPTTQASGDGGPARKTVVGRKHGMARIPCSQLSGPAAVLPFQILGKRLKFATTLPSERGAMEWAKTRGVAPLA
jgi:hypothetical protein